MQIGEGAAKASGASKGLDDDDDDATSEVLEVGFFFDGTLNHGGHAMQRDDGSSYANARTNVALLHPLYPTDVVQSGGRAITRRAVYLPGIGTSDGGDDLVDAAFGVGNTGVSARVHEACRQLAALAGANAYAEVIVDAFGFSRGAAAARYFVNCVNRRSFEPVSSGVITDEEPTALGRVQLPAATVRFVGVFDTVAAIGHAGNPDVSDADNQDVNVHVRDGSARAIVHLVADNEYRENFALNSIRTSSGTLPSGGVELVLPGAHSDVGGGYRPDQRGETVIPVPRGLDYFASRAEADAARERFRHSISEFSEWVMRESFAGRATQEFHLRRNVVEGGHDAGDGRPYMHEGLWVWARSTIRAGLENIALAIMHERAQSNAVPLAALPTNAEHDIPSEIRHIHGALRGGGSPSRFDLALLRMNYVHWSAHYGRVDGHDPEAFDRDSVIPFAPHAPARGFRRRVHHNQPGSAW